MAALEGSTNLDVELEIDAFGEGRDKRIQVNFWMCLLELPQLAHSLVDTFLPGGHGAENKMMN